MSNSSRKILLCGKFSSVCDGMRSSARTHTYIHVVFRRILKYLLLPLLSPLIAPSIIHQTNQDWMKPGTRADREEIVRILVEDLKADVNVLDMHDYRYNSS